MRGERWPEGKPAGRDHLNRVARTSPARTAVDGRPIILTARGYLPAKSRAPSRLSAPPVCIHEAVVRMAHGRRPIQHVLDCEA